MREYGLGRDMNKNVPRSSAGADSFIYEKIYGVGNDHVPKRVGHMKARVQVGRSQIAQAHILRRWAPNRRTAEYDTDRCGISNADICFGIGGVYTSAPGCLQ